MKRIGKITYEFSEEEYDFAQNLFNQLDWVIEDNDTDELRNIIFKLRQLFDDLE